MGAQYRKRGKRSWLIDVHDGSGQRERKTIRGTEKDAKDLCQWINRQELAGINVVEALRKAHAAPAPVTQWPRLRDALPAFIDDMASKGEWTGSTPISYRRRLATHLYDFELPGDGRKLGELPADQVREPMIGACLEHVRRAGGSLAIQEQIRSPLRRFYRDLMKKHGFPYPNPAADLRII